MVNLFENVNLKKKLQIMGPHTSSHVFNPKLCDSTMVLIVERFHPKKNRSQLETPTFPNHSSPTTKKTNEPGKKGPWLFRLYRRLYSPLP